MLFLKKGYLIENVLPEFLYNKFSMGALLASRSRAIAKIKKQQQQETQKND